MIHDMMDYRLNRLNLPKDFDPSSSQDPKKKSPSFFDLDEDLDQFWSIHRFSQFPQVAGMFLFLLTISFYSPPPPFPFSSFLPPSLPFPFSSFLLYLLQLRQGWDTYCSVPISMGYLNLTCYLVLFSPSQPLHLPLASPLFPSLS